MDDYCECECKIKLCECNSDFLKQISDENTFIYNQYYGNENVNICDILDSNFFLKILTNEISSFVTLEDNLCTCKNRTFKIYNFEYMNNKLQIFTNNNMKKFYFKNCIGFTIKNNFPYNVTTKCLTCNKNMFFPDHRETIELTIAKNDINSIFFHSELFNYYLQHQIEKILVRENILTLDRKWDIVSSRKIELITPEGLIYCSSDKSLNWCVIPIDDIVGIKLFITDSWFFFKSN